MAWHDAPWLTYAVVVTGLLAVHLVASGGTGHILPSVLQRVSLTPATTLSRAQNHLIAGFFHHSWGHLAFNVAVFTASWWVAARGHHPLVTAGTFYAIGPLVVLLTHLVLVRPMAASGVPYAQAALTVPLVGFSVMAYATAGMALAKAPLPWLVAGSAFVVAFELVVGLALRLTTPFVWTYHVLGFLAGLAVRRISG